MKTRTFDLAGFTVEVFDFGYAQYMYPVFNGNAEFKVNHDGFRGLSRSACKSSLEEAYAKLQEALKHVNDGPNACVDLLADIGNGMFHINRAICESASLTIAAEDKYRE